MFYRVRQFFQVLLPQLGTLELEQLRVQLPPAALSLFFAQSTAEQRHAIAVAKLIQSWEPPISPDENRTLLLAALFHDCGKTLIKVRLWQRVFIVLIAMTPDSFQGFVRKTNTPLALPLRLSSGHSRWGSRLAKKAGLGPEVCKLIQEHHCPESYLGSILQKADNHC
ncbi:MAG: HD domain-containing protein [Desulfitobacteriaceae bacterium]